jgi:hypothetical protein
MFRRPALGLALAIGFVFAGAAPALAAHTRVLGHWTLNEYGSQTAFDISEQGNHGTLGSSPDADSNDPTWLAGTDGGFRGLALRFGGDDFVEVADSAALEPEDVTLDAWVRGTSTPGPFRYLASKGALRCDTASYGLYTHNDGGLIFYVSDGRSFTLSPNAGTRIWDGRWHHVAGTFSAWDGSRVRMYVDGKQVGNGNVSQVKLSYGLPDNDRFYIGEYRGNCEKQTG